MHRQVHCRCLFIYKQGIRPPSYSLQFVMLRFCWFHDKVVNTNGCLFFIDRNVFNLFIFVLQIAIALKWLCCMLNSRFQSFFNPIIVDDLDEVENCYTLPLPFYALPFINKINCTRLKMYISMMQLISQWILRPIWKTWLI